MKGLLSIITLALRKIKKYTEGDSFMLLLKNLK